MLSRRLPRAVLLGTFWVVAVIGACVLGFGVASAFVSDSGEPPPPNALIPAGGEARPRVAAEDVSPHNRPWAVRVYLSQTKLACPEVGRVDGELRDGEFGTVASDGTFSRKALGDATFGRVDPASGKFIAYPALDQAGSCVDPAAVRDATIVVNHYPAEGVRGARAVAFGVLADNVRRVALDLDGTQEPVAVAGAAYVAVLQEDDAPRSTLIFTRIDGTTRAVPVVPPGGSAPVVQPPPEQPTASPTP
jgi:hypothetical protein